jgi:hypothetical protein
MFMEIIAVVTKTQKKIYIYIQDDQNVCAPDDYSPKKHAKYFKQFQPLTMIT